MSSSLGVINNLGIFAPAVEKRAAQHDEIYREHCHRIYSLAFWMTDNELSAEQLAGNTFLRAFVLSPVPGTEQIDQALLAEIREFTQIGKLTLNCDAIAETTNVRGNVKRVHLERAVVQLPATEKLIFLLHDVEGYSHHKIARLIAMDARESQLGLHQARLRIRELVSCMV